MKRSDILKERRMKIWKEHGMKNEKRKRRMETGFIIVSEPLAKRAHTDDKFCEFAYRALLKYLHGDLGDVKENDLDLYSDEPISGKYTYPDSGEKVLVVTDHSDSWGKVTYVIFEAEYRSRKELLNRLQIFGHDGLDGDYE